MQAAKESKIKPRPNQLGAKGWFWAGNYKIERYLYILHRVTGLGMLLFFSFHLFETTVMRTQGESVWEATMRFLENPLFEIGIVLVAFAFVIHAVNGIRLILQELGFFMDKPKRPLFPYRDSLRKHRGFTMIIIAIMIIGIVVFLLNWIMGGAA
jgi:succinate dehydrogenase / fumarate reductase cytochrome b subunit